VALCRLREPLRLRDLAAPDRRASRVGIDAPSAWLLPERARNEKWPRPFSPLWASNVLLVQRLDWTRFSHYHTCVELSADDHQIPKQRHVFNGSDTVSPC